MNEILACRACLATDVALCRITDLYSQEVYQHLTNITFQNPHGKPQFLCYECNAQIKRSKYFRDKCLRAEGVLNQLLLSDVGLTQISISLFDRKSYKLISRCTRSQIESICIKDSCIKTEKYEIEINYENYDDIEEIKSGSNNPTSRQNDKDILNTKQENESLLNYETRHESYKDIEEVKSESDNSEKNTRTFEDDGEDHDDIFKEINNKLLNYEKKLKSYKDIKKEKSESNNDEIDINSDSDTFKQNDYDNFDCKQDSDSEDNVPLVSLTKKRKIIKRDKVVKKGNQTRKGFRENYAKEVILTKEQQIEEMNARSNSKHYIHAPFKCTDCFKGFVDESAFNNHMGKHDKSNGDYQCEICKLRYESGRQLRAHGFTVHCRKYDCVRCAHRSQTAHQARDHERWHAGHQYECKLCGQKFSKPTSHLTHMRKLHPTEFVCDQCGHGFIGRHGLVMHKSKTHRNLIAEPVGPESERFCSDCNILFVSADAWKLHVVTSIKHVLASKNSDVCRVCGSRFATNTELLKHMKDHTTKRRAPRPPLAAVRHACAICNAQFTNKSKLHMHINRVHLGIKYNKNMVCEICGKKCTSNATLKYHQRTHTGEKPYPCTDCGKKFADSNQLRIHARTHSGSKPYSCQICPKSFRQRPALNRHMRVHTGAKPYACQYCAKTFSQSNSMKLHVRTVHFKEPPNNKRKIQNAFPPPIAPINNIITTVNT